MAAAEELLLRDGYARTSMRAIATQAGVSENTKYLSFASRARLLRQVIKLGVQGDETGVPPAGRPAWLEVVAGPVGRGVRPVCSAESHLDDADCCHHRRRRSRRLHPTLPSTATVPTKPPTRTNLLALAAELTRRGTFASGVSAQDAADTIYGLARNRFQLLTGSALGGVLGVGDRPAVAVGVPARLRSSRLAGDRQGGTACEPDRFPPSNSGFGSVGVTAFLVRSLWWESACAVRCADTGAGPGVVASPSPCRPLLPGWTSCGSSRTSR